MLNKQQILKSAKTLITQRLEKRQKVREQIREVRMIWPNDAIRCIIESQAPEKPSPQNLRNEARAYVRDYLFRRHHQQDFIPRVCGEDDMWLEGLRAQRDMFRVLMCATRLLAKR